MTVHVKTCISLVHVSIIIIYKIVVATWHVQSLFGKISGSGSFWNNPWGCCHCIFFVLNTMYNSWQAQQVNCTHNNIFLFSVLLSSFYNSYDGPIRIVTVYMFRFIQPWFVKMILNDFKSPSIKYSRIPKPPKRRGDICDYHIYF